MKVGFKCLLSGTVVYFEHDHDIKEMRKHPQYEEVVVSAVEEPVTPIKKARSNSVSSVGN